MAAIASLLGLGNSFRMLRLPDITPAADIEGASFGWRYPRCAGRGTPSAHVRIVPATESAWRRAAAGKDGAAGSVFVAGWAGTDNMVVRAVEGHYG